MRALFFHFFFSISDASERLHRTVCVLSGRENDNTFVPSLYAVVYAKFVGGLALSVVVMKSTYLSSVAACFSLGWRRSGLSVTVRCFSACMFCEVPRLERYALYCPCTLLFASWLSVRIGSTSETRETRGTHGTQMSLLALFFQSSDFHAERHILGHPCCHASFLKHCVSRWSQLAVSKIDALESRTTNPTFWHVTTHPPVNFQVSVPPRSIYSLLLYN